MLGQMPRPAAPREHRQPTRARSFLLVAALAAVAVLGTVGASYARAITYPGDASWQVRTVEWVRDHGDGGLVDAVENWWYAHNRPTGAAPAPGSLPLPGAASTPAPAATVHPPQLRVLAGAAPLPGEAVWQPSVQRVAGVPPLLHAYFRPNPAYPSQIVGVAWLDRSLMATRLIAGTREPGGTWPEGARVPPELRSSLLGAFNSGWQLEDTAAASTPTAVRPSHFRTAPPPLSSTRPGASRSASGAGTSS